MKKQVIAAALTFSLVLGGSVTALTPTAHAATAVAQGTSGTIVNGSPYFHKTPVSGEATMGFVRKGSVVKVLEITNRYWVKIEYNGTIGYVSSRYINVNNTTASQPTTSTSTETTSTAPQTTAPSTSSSAAWSQSADKLIAYAKSLMGKVQYGYAKRDTNNPNRMLLDCSSFTQYVYKQSLGIKMGWGANIQNNSFPHVSKSNLRKGDLVFFSVSNPNKIGHVGIYMGEGKFIHNVNPRSNVVISDLSSGYWERHYMGAARPIK